MSGTSRSTSTSCRDSHTAAPSPDAPSSSNTIRTRIRARSAPLLTAAGLDITTVELDQDEPIPASRRVRRASRHGRADGCLAGGRASLAGRREGRHPALGGRSRAALSRSLPGSPAAGGRPRRNRRLRWRSPRSASWRSPSHQKVGLTACSANSPTSLLGLQWHGAAVVRSPEGAVALAGNDHCAVQALRVGSRAWGVQFHVEVEASTIPKWAQVPEYEEALARTGSSAASLEQGRRGAVSRPMTEATQNAVPRDREPAWPASPFPDDDRRRVRRRSAGTRDGYDRPCRRGPWRTGCSMRGSAACTWDSSTPRGFSGASASSPPAPARAFEEGWSFIDAIQWWAPDDSLWHQAGATSHPAAVDPGSGRRYPFATDAALLLRRVRAAAVRALSPVPAAPDGGAGRGRRSRRCGRRWEFECIVLQPDGGGGLPATTRRTTPSPPPWRPTAAGRP